MWLSHFLDLNWELLEWDLNSLQTSIIILSYYEKMCYSGIMASNFTRSMNILYKLHVKKYQLYLRQMVARKIVIGVFRIIWSLNLFLFYGYKDFSSFFSVDPILIPTTSFLFIIPYTYKEIPEVEFFFKPRINRMVFKDIQNSFNIDLDRKCKRNVHVCVFIKNAFIAISQRYKTVDLFIAFTTHFNIYFKFFRKRNRDILMI